MPCSHFDLVGADNDIAVPGVKLLPIGPGDVFATLFNLALIGLVLLIAYWWANQGFFSSLLHLICVIVAGTIALAVWEPVTVNLLLSGGMFDNYAWGVSESKRIR